ncbi:ABC transporter ATP-binding protein [Populibacterium corticicola]|uniref:ABC transporter ATP-binding protein n=1 Tax=Populibacterium corticicola TaxID=1812826 RepID=A0ABW5XEU7_9MICO
MTTSAPIIFDSLSKSFGTKRAVDNLSFTVQPGRVTGFLGPNGSGKTTTLRMLLGLTRPTSGTARIGSKHYTELADPLTVVGAALEASSFHPGRTARDHLRAYAPLAGASNKRVDELLELVDLKEAKNQRVGGYSLGMRQRLALATALLGNPRYLILDEPANGLDPMGIRWLRDFLRQLAADGVTVLVSSHILSEVQQSVDDVIIIANGQLRYANPISELHTAARPKTRVVTPNGDAFAQLARTNHWVFEYANGAFDVSDLRTAAVGTAAFSSGIELHELSDRTESLEDFFFRLTSPLPAAPPVGAPVVPADLAPPSGDPSAENTPAQDNGGTQR